ncbi:MAG: hypothetical protein IIA99_03000, partial [Proteobacteria bacterium]|nr:hypothetical protein [Pseudomonadota bacterium]
MMIRATFISVVVIISVLAPVFSYHTLAAVPQFINYQSRLRDSDSNAVTTATTIQFSIYNHSSNGSPSDTASSTGPLLWTENYNQGSGSCIQVDPDSDGYFTVQLGTCSSFPDYLDFTSTTLYVGVKIGTDSEATPRARLGTAPYAFTADHVFGTNQSSIGTTTPVSGAVLTVEATSTSAIAAVIRGFAGQVADLFRVITAAG